ncbi:unnamed protein product [Boreogadus saida]
MHGQPLWQDWSLPNQKRVCGSLSRRLGGLMDPLGGLMDPLGGLMDPLGGLMDPLGGLMDPLGGCGQSACSVWVRLSVYTIDEVMGFATSLICTTAADVENHRQNRKGKEKRLKLGFPWERWCAAAVLMRFRPAAEQVVPEDLLEQVVPEDLLEQVVPEDLLEQEVPEDLLEQVVPEDLLEQVVPEDLLEQEVPDQKTF